MSAPKLRSPALPWGRGGQADHDDDGWSASDGDEPDSFPLQELNLELGQTIEVKCLVRPSGGEPFYQWLRATIAEVDPSLPVRPLKQTRDEEGSSEGMESGDAADQGNTPKAGDSSEGGQQCSSPAGEHNVSQAERASGHGTGHGIKEGGREAGETAAGKVEEGVGVSVKDSEGSGDCAAHEQRQETKEKEKEADGEEAGQGEEEKEQEADGEKAGQGEEGQGAEEDEEGEAEEEQEGEAEGDDAEEGPGSDSDADSWEDFEHVYCLSFEAMKGFPEKRSNVAFRAECWLHDLAQDQELGYRRLGDTWDPEGLIFNTTAQAHVKEQLEELSEDVLARSKGMDPVAQHYVATQFRKFMDDVLNGVKEVGDQRLQEGKRLEAEDVRAVAMGCLENREEVKRRRMR